MKPSSSVDEDFVLSFGGEQYTCHWGIDELEHMQDRLATPLSVPSIYDMDLGVRLGRIRYQHAMLWAGLRKHHPLADWDAAGKLLQKATEAEYKAMLAGFGYSVRPDPKDAAALKRTSKQANPRKAQTQAKTGANSNSAPADAV